MKKTKRLSFIDTSLNTSVWKYLIMFTFLNALVFFSVLEVTGTVSSVSNGLLPTRVNTSLNKSVTPITSEKKDISTLEILDKFFLNNYPFNLMDGIIVDPTSCLAPDKREFRQVSKVAPLAAVHNVYGQLPRYYYRKSFIKTYYYEKN